MEGSVTIIFRCPTQQPRILDYVKTIDIKKDSVIITGRGFREIYFKDEIHNISADYSVGVYVK